MSPTEDDLRRALSDGAGDVPNVNRIVAIAHERRATRQKRLLSVAAAVIVVGGVASGASYLAHHGSNGNDTASGRAVTNGYAGTSTRPEAGSAHGAMIPFTACPSNAQSSFTPARSASTGQASEKLFTKPVASVTVCSYTSDARVPVMRTSSAYSSTLTISPVRAQFVGTQAQTLVRSLENAATRRPNEACPDYRLASQRSLVILARASDGTLLPAVRTTINEPPCAVVVTNGSTVRYGWTWPQSLGAALKPLTGSIPGMPAQGGVSSGSSSIAPPSDRVNGSPAH